MSLKDESEEVEKAESVANINSHYGYMDWVNEEEEVEFDIVNIDPELLRMPDFFSYVPVQIEKKSYFFITRNVGVILLIN